MMATPSPFTSFVGTWTKAMEDWQATCLAWQQAVTNIQGQRARAIETWWQSAPHFAQNLTAGGPTTNAMETLLTWQGRTVAQAAVLACDITAQRAHLLRQWRNLTLRNMPGGADFTLSSAPPTPSSKTPSSSPSSSSATSSGPAQGNGGTTSSKITAATTPFPSVKVSSTTMTATATAGPQVFHGKLSVNNFPVKEQIPTYMKGTFYPANTQTTNVQGNFPENRNTDFKPATRTVTLQAPTVNTSSVTMTQTPQPRSSGFTPAGVVEQEHAAVSSTTNSFARQRGGASLTRHTGTGRGKSSGRTARGR